MKTNNTPQKDESHHKGVIEHLKETITVKPWTMETFEGPLLGWDTSPIVKGFTFTLFVLRGIPMVFYLFKKYITNYDRYVKLITEGGSSIRISVFNHIPYRDSMKDGFKMAVVGKIEDLRSK